MPCKDCIHYEVCEAHERVNGIIANLCGLFKNKADFVEVVRCKDCKYYEIGKSYVPYCNNVKNLFEEMNPTDFCSYGEKNKKF